MERLRSTSAGRDIAPLNTRECFFAFVKLNGSQWPAGPYLIESRTDHRLLESTGLGFESSSVARTGYVLAGDSWGYGYATEALNTIVNIARELEILHLYALCHPDHPASIRVLEKCGFRFEQRLEQFAEFPNLNPGIPIDCLRYVRQPVPSRDGDDSSTDRKHYAIGRV